MIIVTGGAGFIGSAIVAKLNQRGIKDIIIVDNLATDEKWKNLRKLLYTDYLEHDDFIEMVRLDQLKSLPKIEAIFHMGACSSTTETDCSYLVRNNYEYTKDLANWSIKNDAKFIYASSAATYGNGEKGFDDNLNKIHQLVPLNMYGYSKQMFDLYARTHDLFDKIAGVKYFNVFGPNEYHKAAMRSFVLVAFEQIKKTGKVRLFKSDISDYEDGGQLRDFIYVKDAVDMTLFFYENPQVSGLFNVGTGNARSWNDLAKATFAAMGQKANIEYIDMPSHLKGKYQYYTQANTEKIRQAGYTSPITPLEDAVKDYVQNYLEKDDYLCGF